jgi:hypothetical protein
MRNALIALALLAAIASATGIYPYRCRSYSSGFMAWVKTEQPSFYYGLDRDSVLGVKIKQRNGQIIFYANWRKVK